MRNRLMVAMAVAALFGGVACSSEPTREEALEELADAGFTPETSECVLAALEDDGYTTGDLTGELTSEVEGAIDESVQGCITSDDVDGVVGEGELRTQFIDGLVASGQFDQAQAECMFDELEQAGVDITQMESATDNQTEMQAAVAACL